MLKDNYNKPLLPNSSPKKPKSSSQPIESEISAGEKKKLEEVFAHKKKEFSQREDRTGLKNYPKNRYKKQHTSQQLGFHGLKGKKSLNPRHKQLKKSGRILSQIVKSQNISHIASNLKENRERQYSLIDIKQEDRATRRSIERAIEKQLKNEPNVCWRPRREIEERIYNLKRKYNEDGKRIPLNKRSRETWDWLHSLKPNKSQKNHIPIPIEIFKIFIKGHTRNQCTDLFITFLSVCLNQKSKSKYVSGGQPNFISHFGFHNSYNEMSWKTKRDAFIQKMIARLNTLNWVDLKEIKIDIHKSGKKFYNLVFNSLNKYSRKLTDKEKKRAFSSVDKHYFKKGLDPPKPVYLLGLDLWPVKF